MLTLPFPAGDSRKKYISPEQSLISCTGDINVPTLKIAPVKSPAIYFFFVKVAIFVYFIRVSLEFREMGTIIEFTHIFKGKQGQCKSSHGL